MHDRIAVSAVSSWEWTPQQDVGFWKREGIGHVGLSVTKLRRSGWDESVACIKAAGLRVSSVGTVGYFPLEEPDRWTGPQRGVRKAQELAKGVDAGCTVVVSGSAGRLTWDDAATALGMALAPAVADSQLLSSPPLTLENTASQRVDYGFVHTLRDAADLAGSLGIGVCMEVNSCWAERGLDETIRRAVGAIHLVQVSDFASGSTLSPDRAIIGDGDIPFDRIIGDLLEAGYRGAFEIELMGPQIEQVGYETAILRSIEHLDALLSGLGA